MKTTVKFSEILTTHNKKNLDSWAIQGQAAFIFEENCKSYVVDLNGGSMSTPKVSKDALKQIRQFLLFQTLITRLLK